MLLTDDELSSLVLLSGKRIPHLEEEIFASKSLTECYLDLLDKRRTLVPYSIVAYQYARNVIGGRWQAAETLIAQNEYSATWYAIHVMQRRWPEAEHIILTSCSTILGNDYANLFLNKQTDI